jgi:hypothetical protein
LIEGGVAAGFRLKSLGLLNFVNPADYAPPLPPLPPLPALRFPQGTPPEVIQAAQQEELAAANQALLAAKQEELAQVTQAIDARDSAYGHGNIDLTAGLEVSWSISKRLQLEVTREGAHNMRVRWTNATAQDLGASATLAVGLTLDHAAGRSVGSYFTDEAHTPSVPTHWVATALIRQGEKFARVQFSLGADWIPEDRFDVEALFDLSNEEACKHYEAAVRGDMTGPQRLGAAGPAHGVLECTVTSTLTDAIMTHSDFNAFQLLGYHRDTRTADIQINARRADGTRSDTTEKVYHELVKHLHFYPFPGGKDSVDVATQDRRVTDPKGLTTTGQRADFTVTHVVPYTTASDVGSELAVATLVFGSAATSDMPRPSQDGYGPSTLTVELSLGPRAMKKILGIDEDTFYATYARTCIGKSYVWTADHRATLSRIGVPPFPRGSLAPGETDGSTVAERLEAHDYHMARTVYECIKTAQDGAALAKLDAFPEMAQDTGNKVRMLATLALIAGDQDAKTSFRLEANGLNYQKTAGTVSQLPE